MKKKILLLGLITILILCAALFIAVKTKITEPFQAYDQEVTVIIKPGTSIQKIAAQLATAGVISDARVFSWYFRLAYRGQTLKAGEYIFTEPLSMRGVIEILLSGRGVLIRLTLKEGLTMREMSRVIADVLVMNAEDFLLAAGNFMLIADLDPEASDLEGYLFPDTYLVGRQISPAALIETMIANFRRNFSQDLSWRAHEMGFSIRKTVILASLIEKETASRQERFTVSSVFHNRLRKKMLLDCDPTIIYGLEREGLYRGRLGWAELKHPTPYNTRLYRGLPPGPIANPGLASLEAALFPETTDYLYFVKKDATSHYFSRTLREHNAAVRKYILKK